MADGRYRGRSPPVQGAPKGAREGLRPSRSSRSPERDRDRGSRPQRYADQQYGFPGENNYRPRYSSPPLTRTDSMPETKGSSGRNSTSDSVHPARTPLTKSDTPTEPAISDPATAEDTTMAQLENEIAKALAPVLQQVLAAMNHCSTLQLRENVVQREFERRLAEFKSSEPLHEKYPAVADVQVQAKARAEAEFKAVSEEVKLTQSALGDLVNDLAAQSVSRFVQHILRATTDTKRQESQQQEVQQRQESQAGIEVLQQSILVQQKSNDDKFQDMQRQLEEAQKQLEAQQQTIGNLLKSHEEKYKSVEESNSRLSVQSAYTKAVLNEDFQPKVTSALARIAILESDTKTLSTNFNATKELTARLQADIPQDLRPRLEKLSSLQDHVARLPKLQSDLDDIRQESERSNKGLVKHMKNMEQLGGFYEKINSLDLIIHGARIPFSKGLSATVTELVSKTAGAPATAVPAKTPPVGPHVDFESLKSELLEVVEEKQSAGDAVIMAHSARLEKDVEDTRNRQQAMEELCFERIAILTSQIERLETSFELRLKQNLDDATVKVLNSIQLTPDILPLATIQSQFLKTVESRLELHDTASSQAVMDKLESVSDGLVVLEQRFKKITTKEMAMFILSQMDATYPDVRNVQDMLRDFNTKLGHHHGQFDRLISFTNSLKAQIDALETRVSETGSNENSSLRGEVDNLAIAVGKIQGAANAAKAQNEITRTEDAKSYEQIANLLSILGVDMEETKAGLQEVKASATAKADAVAAKVDAASNKADAAADKADAAATKADAAATKADTAAAKADSTLSGANISSATAAPSRSMSTSVSSSRPMTERSGPSHPLIQGDSSNKRRKLDGSHSSQGMSQSLKVPNGSRRRKRHKFGLGEYHEDDSEDSTFEPNQPSLSDDGDEF